MGGWPRSSASSIGCPRRSEARRIGRRSGLLPRLGSTRGDERAPP
jgi:hypothetical protein